MVCFLDFRDADAGSPGNEGKVFAFFNFVLDRVGIDLKTEQQEKSEQSPGNHGSPLHHEVPPVLAGGAPFC
jgi:hypothetical protein